MAHRTNPTILFAAPLLLAVAAGAAAAQQRFGGPWWAWLLAAINLAAFAAYGLDKRLASAQRLRIPEIVLLGLALLGGSPGALAGMLAFRHKTRKVSFRVWFGLIVAAQAAALVAFAMRS